MLRFDRQQNDIGIANGPSVIRARANFIAQLQLRQLVVPDITDNNLRRFPNSGMKEAGHEGLAHISAAHQNDFLAHSLCEIDEIIARNTSRWGRKDSGRGAGPLSLKQVLGGLAPKCVAEWPNHHLWIWEPRVPFPLDRPGS